MVSPPIVLGSSRLRTIEGGREPKLTHVSSVRRGTVASLGSDSGSTSHDLGHDGILEVGQGHSHIGVVLLGQEEIPQSQLLGTLLELLHNNRVRLPSQGRVIGNLIVERRLCWQTFILRARCGNKRKASQRPGGQSIFESTCPGLMKARIQLT